MTIIYNFLAILTLLQEFLTMLSNFYRMAEHTFVVPKEETQETSAVVPAPVSQEGTAAAI